MADQKKERDQILDETERLTKSWIDRGVKMSSALSCLVTFAATIAVSHGVERGKYLELAALLYDTCERTTKKRPAVPMEPKDPVVA